MKIGKFEVVSQMQRTAKELSNVCCISIFPVKLFILPVVLKNGTEIYHGDRNLLISKKCQVVLVLSLYSVHVTMKQKADLCQESKVRKPKIQVYMHHSNRANETT